MVFKSTKTLPKHFKDYLEGLKNVKTCIVISQLWLSVIFNLLSNNLLCKLKLVCLIILYPLRWYPCILILSASPYYNAATLPLMWPNIFISYLLPPYTGLCFPNSHTGTVFPLVRWLMCPFFVLFRWNIHLFRFYGDLIRTRAVKNRKIAFSMSHVFSSFSRFFLSC